MVDTRNNFRFVEVVNNDDRENYTKLVLKKVYTLPVDKDNNNTQKGTRRISSKVEQMRKNFEPPNGGFSYLRPSLFTPKPFSSSLSNLHSSSTNGSSPPGNKNNRISEHTHQETNINNNSNQGLNSNDPIYANKPIPRPAVPPKPRYKKPPPLPLFDNDRPKCASPVPELPESPSDESSSQSFLNNLKNIKNLRQSAKKSSSSNNLNLNHNNIHHSYDNINTSQFSNKNHTSQQSVLENRNSNHRAHDNKNHINMNGGSTSPSTAQVTILGGGGSSAVISPKIKSSSSLTSSSPVSNNYSNNHNVNNNSINNNNNVNNNNHSVTTSPQYKELFEQKSQIRERLFSKIEVLREEERELANEKVEIDFQTRRFYVRLLDKNESDADKFSQFIQEIQQISKLKVGLVLRLDKLENGGHLKYTPEETMKKQAQLQSQILEAENLQKNTDRRRKVQNRIIQSHFGNKDTSEFQGMIDNLTRIVRDQREMEHKITIGNEKLRALDDIG